MTVAVTLWTPGDMALARLEFASLWRRSARNIVKAVVEDALNDEDAPDDLAHYRWTPVRYRCGLPAGEWEVRITGKLSAPTPNGRCVVPYIVAWSVIRREAVLCVGP